jgi:A/G-specific adenine glycosylase
MRIKAFQSLVYRYYKQHGRQLPWRKTTDPYRIVVSEIMLQQTQASRVVEKYKLFVRSFPTIRRLACAAFQDVLAVWQGLGYNRRALLLHRLAKRIVFEGNGSIPAERERLRDLPGIGEATSGEIMAFAFDKPVVFIETNIRSVFIHHFFPHRLSVADAELLPFIEKTLDRQHPRQWYYALMDYGVFLKATIANPGRKSRHYALQSKFKGSDRQIRGMVLKLLVGQKRIALNSLLRSIGFEKDRVRKLVFCLCQEGLLQQHGVSISIAR